MYIRLYYLGPPQAINGVEVQIRSGEIAFSWTYDDSANGVPATAFVITIVRAGNTVLTRTIPVTQRSYTIDVNDLDSSEEHTVTLMVQNLQGNSQTVSNIFTTPGTDYAMCTCI